MKFERSAGILLHPASLPGKYGIGELGHEAFTYIDFLKETGCKLWQVLPLGPSGYGDSPYQSFSAFAGNPLLISLEILSQEGLLLTKDLINDHRFQEDRIDYGAIIPWKLNLLEKAFINFKRLKESLILEFESFCEEKKFWLNDYALFMSLKELNRGGSWVNWPDYFKNQKQVKISNSSDDLKFRMEKYKFFQFIFFRQWLSIKAYANGLGINIIGDIPLYVAHDSADVWSHPDLFQLNDNGNPTVIAGVPPDYFSSTGQLWGNPIYRWEVHKNTGYKWWMERIKNQLKLVDIIRLDHFRGFSGYWEIPASNLTAEQGRWVQGPGMDFFTSVISNLSAGKDLPFIAEDLGEITPDVNDLRKHLNIPGMKILQFAFSGPENIYLPHHYNHNCVVYTGTHDNDTSLGWFNEAPEKEKVFAKEYLRSGCNNIVWDLIRAGWSSVAVFAIAPMQDILTLDSSARMNYPGRMGGNWNWKMGNGLLEKELMEKLKGFNRIYGRD